MIGTNRKWPYLALAAVVVGLGTTVAALATSRILDPAPGAFGVGEPPVATVAQLRATDSDDFATEQLVVSALDDVVIELYNDDVLPHDVAIETDSGVMMAGEPAQPGQSVRYEFGPVPAGQHRFFCTLHPWMQGVLDAQASGGVGH